MLAEETAALIAEYYDSWKGGGDSFDAERLRRVLAADLDFEGPIAGKRRGAEGFVAGLGRFAESLKGLVMLEEVRQGDQAAFLYDCDLGAGTLRFAEFIRVGDGKIEAVKLLYDADRYRALGAR